MPDDFQTPNDPPVRSTECYAPDPRIAWHMKRNPALSELAVKLALAAGVRCDSDASHDWEAHNAARFENVLMAHNEKADR
jgi:hypothetical protein